jgi:competence protein ComEA
MWKSIQQIKSKLPQSKVILVRLILLSSLMALVTLALTFPGNSSSQPSSISFAGEIPLISNWSEIYVDVSGAVNKPGLYKLGGDMRVGQLIDQAGGLSIDADLVLVAKEINLAEKILDQTKIYIPFKQQKASVIADASTGQSKLSLANATVEDLEKLPGVGPVLAQAIFAAKPFKDLSALLDVTGVGQAKYEQLLELVQL